MFQADLIASCIKNNKVAKKQFFDTYFGKISHLALRYSKNSSQSEHIAMQGFAHVFSKLNQFKSQSSLTINEFIKHEFISFAVNYIKEIRSEYYVASTVKAIDDPDKTYDLFLDSKFIDVKNVNKDVLIKSLQSLVPSQRMTFNLVVIDNYSLLQTSEFLDTNEQSIKSTLEKARFNLQKNIETNLKLSNYESAV